MKFLSEDGKLFNTEKECCEHEKNLESAGKEWKQMYDKFYIIYSEFCEIVKEYGGKYEFKKPVSYPEIDDFMNNLKCPKYVGMVTD